MKRILLVSSFLAIIFGTVLIGGGIWGLTFTYKNVARENITTPDDASIPGVPVRGPFTLKAQGRHNQSTHPSHDRRQNIL